MYVENSSTYLTNDENFEIYSTNKNQIKVERRNGLKPGYSRLYMYVSDDEYELPMVVATSAQELADVLGCKQRTVIEQLSNYRAGRRKTQFRTVDVPMEDEDE